MNRELAKKRAQMAIDSFEEWEREHAINPDGSLRLTYIAEVTIPISVLRALIEDPE